MRYGTSAGRWVLVATIVGSSMAALDSTVVNVALPAIGKDLHAAVAGLQWLLSGYLVTLCALLLLGGSLGDLYGRLRLLRLGAVWFATASLLCALAPDLGALLAARALQGIGGALLVPGSLAIVQASFVEEDRSRAIGAWSGLGGIAAAIGPVVGGWLVQAASWRLIFVLNLPLALAVLVASRHLPEARDEDGAPAVDVAGAVLATLGLSSGTYALIEGSSASAWRAVALGAGALAIVALIGFVLVERRSAHPMLPLAVFSSRQFSAANVTTLAVYGALGAAFFLLAVDLQQVLGYTPADAGASLLPVTAILLALSASAGRLAARIGPRLPMTLGPLIVAAGLLLMRRIGPGAGYLTGVLPAVVVFGLGLALTVAPLTSAVLTAVDASRVGVASGVNNTAARLASLVAVALLPALAGLSGTAYLDPSRFSAGFHAAVTIAAGLCALGGLASFVGIRDAAGTGGGEVPARRFACPVDGPGPGRDSRI
ncbi:MAG TPA: MFS transporter [Acidimicrobiales bacterium]|nr:MFS transporter [Acidimicrobiales bacterium]